VKRFFVNKKNLVPGKILCPEIHFFTFILLQPTHLWYFSNL